MEMHHCNSSLIISYGYDQKKMEMDIDFNVGGVYRYFGVNQERFEEFLRAPSKGKHFLSNIKGKYDFEKR